MPLPLATIDLAFTIANGLIKLGGRIDESIAQNIAQRRGVILPQHVDVMAPHSSVMVEALKAVVHDFDGRRQSNELTGDDISPDDRARIVGVIGVPDGPEAEDIGAADLIPLMELYATDQLKFTVDDPDALAKYAYGLIEDGNVDPEEAAKVVYYLGPGADQREQGVAWQIGMAIFAAVAEFGVAYQERLIKDQRTRRIVSAVLNRLSSEEMLKTASGRDLASKILGATLNGALDARDDLDQDTPYLDALLSALADARDGVSADKRDDYLLGLVRGRGYKRLVSELLDEGAVRLGAEDREPFQKVIADVLKNAKQHVDTGELDRSFFDDHWADLVRAALRSVHRNGPALLADQDDIVREALLAAVKSMAASNDPKIFSEDAFYKAVESAISTVAAKPELLGAGDRGAWFQAFYLPFAEIVADAGIRKAFSADKLEGMVRGVAEQIARRPDLIGGNSKLPQELTKEILSRVAAAETLGLEDLAQAAVDGALHTVAENPALLHNASDGSPSSYALIAADLAGSLAERVKDGKITRGEAEILAKDGLRSLGRHGPALLEKEHPVVQVAFSAAVDTLSAGENFNGLSSETVVTMIETAIIGLAERDDLIDDGRKQAFATAFFKPFAEVIQDGGIRATFTDEGLQDLLAGVAGKLAEQPELLVGGNQLPQAVVAGMLKSIAASGALRVDALAEAGVTAALDAIAANPGLLVDTAAAQPNPFAGVVASIAGSLAERVRTKGLARPDAAALLQTAVEAVSANPALLQQLKVDLAERIIARVLDAADGNPGMLLRGSALVWVVHAALRAMTRHGMSIAVDDDNVPIASETIAQFLFGIVDEGLKRAADDLGRQVDLESIPLIIGLLIDRWAAGEMPVISRTDPEFEKLWAKLAEEMRQRAVRGELKIAGRTQ